VRSLFFPEFQLVSAGLNTDRRAILSSRLVARDPALTHSPWHAAGYQIVQSTSGSAGNSWGMAFRIGVRGGELLGLRRLRGGPGGAVPRVSAAGERGAEPRHLLSRIFRLLDPAAFPTCFGRFLDGLGTAGEGVVAIDGKTLPRSFDDTARGNPLAVVSAFASASRLVLGQQSFRVAEGDSEILAARTLLECLGLSGQLVTADAIHCQRETAQVIREHSGDYLLLSRGTQFWFIRNLGASC
jgi:hypothetical protein